MSLDKAFDELVGETVKEAKRNLDNKGKDHEDDEEEPEIKEKPLLYKPLKTIPIGYHIPYVRLLVKADNPQNLPGRLGDQIYIKCFVEQESPKATPELKYVLQSSSRPNPNLTWGQKMIWEANLRFGEVARIQVWRKFLSGDDVFLGEICDNRSLLHPKLLAYDYFTDQSLVKRIKEKKNLDSKKI